MRFYNIKKFDEAYNPEVRGRIDTIKPGYYTRMGTAIRYATSLLEKETTNQKLLLILTDGKPTTWINMKAVTASKIRAWRYSKPSKRVYALFASP